jgi:hypothetical protein
MCLPEKIEETSGDRLRLIRNMRNVDNEVSHEFDLKMFLTVNDISIDGQFVFPHTSLLQAKVLYCMPDGFFVCRQFSITLFSIGKRDLLVIDICVFPSPFGGPTTITIMTLALMTFSKTMRIVSTKVNV